MKPFPPKPARARPHRAARKAPPPRLAPPRSRPAQWNLRLYVAGETATSRTALRHLTTICEEHLGGRYRIEVVDLVAAPERAARDQIAILPTLILPGATKRIVGDLSDHHRVLSGLDLHPSHLSPRQLRN